MNESVTQSSGTLSLEDIDRWLDTMFEHERSNDDSENFYFHVSPESMWRVRLIVFYAQHRLPKRKLRKCLMRKRQARINQGRRQLQQRQEREQREMGMSHREIVDAIYGTSRIEKLVEEVKK